MKTYSLVFLLSFFFAINLTAQDLAVLSDKKKPITKTSKTTFIPNLELRASFNGGLKELAKFLESNLVYPELGRENNLEGTVIIEFTVAVDGSIQKAKVVKGLGFGFDKEALRLVKRMPKWKPAQQGARVVASKVRMPIQFKL